MNKNAKVELKSLVAGDIKIAIENFEQLVSDNPTLFNQLILLKGRYLDTRKFFNLNIEEKSKLDIELNKIRNSLLDLIDAWNPKNYNKIQEKTYQELKDHLRLFPWTELINKGLIHLFGMKEKLEGIKIEENINEALSLTKEYTSRNQIRNHRDIQISLISKDRFFIFHDWEYMTGSLAKHHDIVTGIDIYNTVFSFPFGMIGWMDRTSNHAHGEEFTFRENIGLFTAIDEARIFVELHNEK